MSCLGYNNIIIASCQTRWRSVIFHRLPPANHRAACVVVTESLASEPELARQPERQARDEDDQHNEQDAPDQKR
jgi:hypothetical protein